YDPATGTWSATGSLNAQRYFPTVTLLQNGKVLAAAGNDYDFVNNQSIYLKRAEIYDPGTGLWSTTGSLATARSQFTTTLLSSGKVLAVAGLTRVAGNLTNLSSAELYDPVLGTWSLTGSLNTARYNHKATLLPTGKVLVAG